MSDGIIQIIVVVVVIYLVGCLLLREFRCWYWKYNAMLEEQRETNRLLRAIYQATLQNTQVNAFAAGSTASQGTASAVDDEIPDL